MKLSRLHGRKINDYIRRKGNVWKGRTMTIRWLPGAPRHPGIDPAVTAGRRSALFVGTAASAKLNKSAVRRNRMRRRCREALRLVVHGREKVRTMQLLITPKEASLTCSFKDIHTDVVSFLSQHA